MAEIGAEAGILAYDLRGMGADRVLFALAVGLGQLSVCSCQFAAVSYQENQIAIVYLGKSLKRHGLID
jgi:hypothetical protein